MFLQKKIALVSLVIHVPCNEFRWTLNNDRLLSQVESYILFSIIPLLTPFPAWESICHSARATLQSSQGPPPRSAGAMSMLERPSTLSMLEVHGRPGTASDL